MSKRDKLQTAMNWIAGAAGLYFAGITFAGAIKRKREQSTTPNKVKSIVSGIGATVTPTGNVKTTVRDAWKNHRTDDERWVIFKDIEEPKDTQVWIIDEYDRAERAYLLYNFADTSRYKYVKGDKVCFTGFTF